MHPLCSTSLVHPAHPSRSAGLLTGLTSAVDLQNQLRRRCVLHLCPCVQKHMSMCKQLCFTVSLDAQDPGNAG